MANKNKIKANLNKAKSQLIKGPIGNCQSTLSENFFDFPDQYSLHIIDELVCSVCCLLDRPNKKLLILIVGIVCTIIIIY